MTQMPSKQGTQITTLFVFCQILYASATQQCGSESSIYGKMLRRHTFHKMHTQDVNECLQACNFHITCQSFNYVIKNDNCELNNRTKEARPVDFVSDEERFYMKRDIDRAPLGSISELPAESCKEIKASEGGEAVSGKYWFDSILPGKTVLAYCDMETEDVDECSVSSVYIFICDANATCQNAVGSFSCACKSGFSGNGKRCADIDECSTSSHNCDENAVCENTVGSHTCQCKAGFSGNGRLCTDIDECAVNTHDCGANADCRNTMGSHTCKCKVGFTGDGRLCTDINECTTGVHSCLSSVASCGNTVGSYSCACNQGYAGDGITSCTPPTTQPNQLSECVNYQSLTSADRKITYTGQSPVLCDRNLATGWYRFEGAAGTRMPESCPERLRCGTHVTGWLDGAHPTVEQGRTSFRVCGHWLNGCCDPGWSNNNIQVTNCGGFFVYYFSYSVGCSFRYCGTD